MNIRTYRWSPKRIRHAREISRYGSDNYIQTLKAEVDAFKTLKAEVDALQIQAAQERKPWYFVPSNIVSVVALVFSLGTSVFSYWKSYQTEVATNRAEVRQLIQRTTRLPIENFELLQKFPNAQGLTTMITQEQLLLANQAAEKIKRYPDTFTSTEYFAAAGALANVNSPAHVSEFLLKAIELATTANDYLVACRSYGHHLFMQSKVDEGRSFYSKAITDVWTRFPSSERTFRRGMLIQTYLHLAASEMMLNNWSEATSAIAKAQSVVDDLPESPFKDYWQPQVSLLRTQLERASAPKGLPGVDF